MKEHQTDLFFNVKMKKIGSYHENIWRIRTKRELSIGEIEEVLNWYNQHYGEPFIPELKRQFDFTKKFASIRKAMRDSTDDSRKSWSDKQSEEDRKEAERMEFDRRYAQRFPDARLFQQKEGNAICREMGIPERF